MNLYYKRGDEMILIKSGEGLIYGLFDPLDMSTHYIGQTLFCVFSRRNEHVVTALKGATAPVSAWIRRLVFEGREPGIYVMDAVPNSRLNAVEKRYIEMGFTRGWPLLNVTHSPKGSRPLSPGRFKAIAASHRK